MDEYFKVSTKAIRDITSSNKWRFILESSEEEFLNRKDGDGFKYFKGMMYAKCHVEGLVGYSKSAQETIYDINKDIIEEALSHSFDLDEEEVDALQITLSNLRRYERVDLSLQMYLDTCHLSRVNLHEMEDVQIQNILAIMTL